MDFSYSFNFPQNLTEAERDKWSEREVQILNMFLYLTVEGDTEKRQEETIGHLLNFRQKMLSKFSDEDINFAFDYLIRTPRKKIRTSEELIRFIQRKIRTEKRKREKPYPIVKFDRATVQDFLPIFMHRGIFSNVDKLPTDLDILKREKERLNRDITFAEGRNALSKKGQYISGSFILRDYGSHAIGFSAKMYEDIIKKTENEIQRKISEGVLFSEINDRLMNALGEIKLWKRAHELAKIILTEAYRQGTCQGLKIPKETIVRYLGEDTSNKAIYQEIREAIYNLRHVDYVIYDYSYTPKTREPSREKSKRLGNFIYDIKDDWKYFTLGINENFVGCVIYLFDKEKKSKAQIKDEFGGRGYFSYPSRAISLSRDKSPQATLLTDFFISERGNPKLNKGNLKVISHKVSKYINVAKIQHSRPDRAHQTFIEALEEIEIIENTEPTIQELKKIKPSRAMNTILRVSVRKNIRDLDKQIEMILEKKK